MKMRAFVVMLMMVSLLFSCAAGNTSAQQMSNDDYMIGADDILIVNVYGERDLNDGGDGKKLRVSASGYITYPFIGRLKVEGKSVSQIEQIISSKLSEGFIVEPKVTIFCEQNARVYVFGQVNRPGAYPLITDMTVLSGIALAGGFNRVAVQNKVKLIRFESGNKKMYEVGIKEIIKGDLSKDIELKRNDTIIVMESFF